MTKKHLEDSIIKIDNMIKLAKTNTTIDVDDLKAERSNCCRELRKLRRQEKSIKK